MHREISKTSRHPPLWKKRLSSSKKSRQRRILQRNEKVLENEKIETSRGPEKFFSETLPIDHLGGSKSVRITAEILLTAGKFVVRGSNYQGDDVFPQTSRGKQCTAMAAAAIAVSHLVAPSKWTTETVDTVLHVGDNVFRKAMESRGSIDMAEQYSQYLTPQELPATIEVASAEYEIVLGTEIFGHLEIDAETDGFPNLARALEKFLTTATSNDKSDPPAAILTSNGMSIAIFLRESLIWVFDSHSRDISGKPAPNGKACIVGFSEFKNFLGMVEENIPRGCLSDPFANQYMLTPVSMGEGRVIVTHNEEEHVEKNMSCDEIPEMGSRAHLGSSSHEEQRHEACEYEDYRKHEKLESEDVSTDDEMAASEDIQRICEEEQSIEAHTLVQCSTPVEDSKCQNFNGRGIYNFGYIWTKLHESFDNHSTMFQCGFENLLFINSRRSGLKFLLRFKCSMCNYEADISSEPSEDNQLDVNTAMVLGSVVNGIGYFQAESFLAAMDVPCMAESTYQRYHESVLAGLSDTAWLEMKKAGEEERKAAIARGDVISGVPHIRVIADGSWMKRSYQSGKFDSPSGTGAIIGEQTGKVLFIGIRNKFCSVCNFASSLNRDPPNHLCFKNWGNNQSSASMEAHAIAEGFRISVEQHGLIYSVLIADGDSSVFNKICELAPYREYDVNVKKIECRNHMYRSARRNLTKIVNTGKLGQLKKVVKSNVENMIRCTRSAVERRLDQGITWAAKIVALRKDIMNIPSHVFGDHAECAGTGYCSDSALTNPGPNNAAALRRIGKFGDIEDCLRRLADNADSLLYSVNNNVVESFHNIIAKFIGGKRINWGKRGSYNARVSGAVVQFNAKRVMTSFISVKEKDPSELISALEERRVRLNELRRQRISSEKYRPKKRVCRNVGPDKDYGPQAEKPDLDEATYKAEYSRHMDKLTEFTKNRQAIERETLLQSDSSLWQSMRRKLITASNFGVICHLKDWTSCSNIVKRLIYPKELGHIASVRYGKQNEDVARKTLEQIYNITVEPCGLFVDAEILGLGATPDGLVGHDMIVEIKCPYSARNGTISEAVAQRKGNIHRVFSGTDLKQINPEHEYHYQIQGQLHVTQRQRCIFMMWTPNESVVVIVDKDDVFWKTKMEVPLIKFYQNCMIPEIIDPRHVRSMPIRDPPYILEAMAKRAATKSMGINDLPVMEALTNDDCLKLMDTQEGNY